MLKKASFLQLSYFFPIKINQYKNSPLLFDVVFTLQNICNRRDEQCCLFVLFVFLLKFRVAKCDSRHLTNCVNLLLPLWNAFFSHVISGPRTYPLYLPYANKSHCFV